MSKKQSVFWSFVQAVAIVSGTIIGAGVLGVPYAISQVGLLAGLMLLLLVGFCMCAVMLYVTEVAHSLEGRHQLTGYIEKYLGKQAKRVFTLAIGVNIYGALLGYTIGQGEVLSSIFWGEEFIWSLMFFLSFSLFIVFGINIIKKLEVFLTIFVTFLLVGITVYMFGIIDTENLLLINSFSGMSIMNTYGVLLFACFGLTAVPQVREILKKQSVSLMKKAVVVGSILPIVLYGLFAIAVIGVTGQNTSEIAVIQLGEQLGRWVVVAGSVLAFFAMASSFVALGLAQRTIFEYDHKLPKSLSIIATLLVPVSLYVFGFRNFIEVIGFVGGLSLSLVGMVAVVLHYKMRASNNLKGSVGVKSYMIYSFVFCFFLVGMVSTLLMVFL